MIDLHRARSWAHLTMGDTLRMLGELREAETRAARFGMARLNCQLKAQRTHVESIFGGQRAAPSATAARPRGSPAHSAT